MDNEVKIIVTTDASGAVVSLRTVSGEALDVGKKTGEAGKSGSESFTMLGRSASNLAQQMGAPHRAASTFGDKVADLAQKSLPGWGMALGVLGIAIAGSVSLIRSFNERADEQRERLRKSGESALDYVVSMRSAIGVTDGLERAMWKMSQTQLVAARFNIRESIKRLTTDMEELEKQNKKTWSTGVAGMTGDDFPLSQKINGLQAKIKELYESLVDVDQLINSPKSPKTAVEDQAAKQAVADQDFEFNRRINEAALAYDQTVYERKQAEREQDLARNQAYHQYLFNTEVMYNQMKLNLAQQAIQGYIAVTGKNNAALFAAQKAIALAMMFVEGQKGAMAAAAAAQIAIPVPGSGAVAYAQYMTMVYAAMAITGAAAIGQISSGSYKGASGGGGGGPVATYPATPSAGQPSSETKQQINVYIYNPLVDDNWQLIAERYIVPALNANGDRGVQLNTQVVRA